MKETTTCARSGAAPSFFEETTMRSPMRRALSFAVVAAVLALPAVASALPAPPSEPAPTSNNDIAYKFKDDPLSAVTNGAQGAAIIVRPSIARISLMRPRYQFVSEMLRAVEHL